MRVSHRLLDDPHLLRRVTYAVAGAAAVISMIGTLAVGPGGYVRAAAYVIPVTVFAALPSRKWRSTVLAVGAGLVAAATSSETGPLWLGIAALVFGSVTEDLRARPWIGWAAGFAGATLGVVLQPGDPNVAAFIGVIGGGSLGLLLRTRLHTLDLAGQAEELRGKAAWLEQRTSLARELHDVVGHHVTAMVVQAEAGRLGDPQVALRNIGDIGRTALGELDAMVVHLRDPESPLPVTAPPRLLDIDELLAEPLRKQGVKVDVRLEPEPGLDDAGVLTVYRIAQEALTNVTRHARAAHAWVELSRSGNEVRLQISDDGVGRRPGSDRGSGLLGIAERVAARGGSWELSPRPGGGTSLDVRLPVEPL
jgi:signal transduction histidine kinase